MIKNTRELELDKTKLDELYRKVIEDITNAPSDKKAKHDFQHHEIHAPGEYIAEIVRCRVYLEEYKSLRPRARARIRRRSDGQYVYESGDWKFKGAARLHLLRAIALLFEVRKMHATSGRRGKLQAPAASEVPA